VGFKGIIAATTSVALLIAPTMAVAQTSAVTARATEITPAGENVQGSELRGGFIIPLIALIAIILGILAALDHGDDLPHSP
jgi:hypothetical protein